MTSSSHLDSDSSLLTTFKASFCFCHSPCIPNQYHWVDGNYSSMQYLPYNYYYYYYFKHVRNISCLKACTNVFSVDIKQLADIRDSQQEWAPLPRELSSVRYEILQRKWWIWTFALWFCCPVLIYARNTPQESIFGEQWADMGRFDDWNFFGVQIIASKPTR